MMAFMLGSVLVRFRENVGSLVRGYASTHCVFPIVSSWVWADSWRDSSVELWAEGTFQDDRIRILFCCG